VASAVSASEADILSGRESLRRTEAQILGQVIQFYVDVRRDQEALRIRQTNVAVLQRQLDERAESLSQHSASIEELWQRIEFVRREVLYEMRYGDTDGSGSPTTVTTMSSS
jgi:outer membrane protein TolC